MVIAGTIRAIGSKTRKLKAGDHVCYVYPHHFDTAVVVNESDCEILSGQEATGDLLGQIHPLITSLHVASLLRLDKGEQVLIYCHQVQLAYNFTQVALIRASGAPVTFYSDAGLGKLQQLGDKAKLIDREAALRQALSGSFFDTVSTDANDRFQLLGNVVKPSGRIIALGSSPPTDMINPAAYFLKKNVAIGMFDPMDGFATIATRQSRSVSIHGADGTSPELTQSRSPLVEAAIDPLTFNPEASYFLVDCLGGLGRSLTCVLIFLYT